MYVYVCNVCMYVCMYILDRNKNITLRLVWDHMPLTGGLFMRSGTPSHTVLPDQYT